MDKVKMESKDMRLDNINKIENIFPNVITEVKDNQGNIKKTINFELLQQELSNEIVEGNKERYQLTWPGKNEAILTANTPINKTLRPEKDDSTNWDTTENLYIEGDNLEVLKLLQESYLNKVKCIYIDPPYNTGKDFVYKDNFTQDKTEYLEESGQMDEEGNRLFLNTDANGRYHSDWLSMMYPRLKLARNLLSEDGVIFISIDDNEVHNLRKICDEIFGERNFVDIFLWTKTSTPPSLSNKSRKTVEFILVYEKNRNNYKYYGSELENGDAPLLNTGNPINRLCFKAGTVNFTFVRDGIFKKGSYDKLSILEDLHIKDGKNENDMIAEGEFKWGSDMLKNEIENGTYFLIKSEKFSIRFQRTDTEGRYKTPNNLLNLELDKSIDIGTNESAVKELNELGLKSYFDYPKPLSLVKYLVNTITYFHKDSIILDFFSGSGTTAHAVMQLNAEDDGNRKYIMVQVPEATDEKSEAYSAGYTNICEIGKERIRRAAKKIKEETNADIDYGFRVYKVDSTNMKDVYYAPNKLAQMDLHDLEFNIKEDRTGLDLLTQVILESGLELSLPMETKVINNKEVHFVGGNSLIACFGRDVDEELIKQIANNKPIKVVFRDISFKDCPSRINLEEIFKGISPNTEIKVL